MTNLHQAVESEVESLRMALARVQRDCQDALDRLNSGQRPGTGAAIGSIFGSNAGEVERHAARLDILLNYVGSELLNEEFTQQALRRKSRF